MRRMIPTSPSCWGYCSSYSGLVALHAVQTPTLNVTKLGTKLTVVGRLVARASLLHRLLAPSEGVKILPIKELAI